MKYAAAHHHVKKVRGPARLHPCVDCRVDADQWSYDHKDPDELNEDGKGSYSPNPWHYQPRCFKCHRKFDQQHRDDDIRAIAESICDQVKDAVRQRNVARKHGDREAEDHWDDELERVMQPLKGIHKPPPTRSIWVQSRKNFGL